jgi:hypothetical protein
MQTYDSSYIVDTLVACAGSLDEFLDVTGDTVHRAFQFVLDGEEDLNSLEGCEKTYIGTKLEKYLLRALGLPSKRTYSPPPKLDTIVAGVDFDIKFTIHHNWMIPPEAVDEWCILIQANYNAKTYSCGVLQMAEENLTKGGNRDRKRSVSKDGKSKINWIARARNFESFRLSCQ